MITAHILVFS